MHAATAAVAAAPSSMALNALLALTCTLQPCTVEYILDASGNAAAVQMLRELGSGSGIRVNVTGDVSAGATPPTMMTGAQVTMVSGASAVGASVGAVAVAAIAAVALTSVVAPLRLRGRCCCSGWYHPRGINPCQPATHSSKMLAIIGKKSWETAKPNSKIT